MNTLKTILTSKFNALVAAFALLVMGVLLSTGIGGVASARTQYSANGNATSTTPIFNEFYDVPGVGDEADFVRIKPKAGSNADYKSTLSDACAPNSSFNVRTYVHNGADPSYNEGAATAVARNTVVAMNAQLNTAKSFNFSSTISSSNAAGMTDGATLNCGSDVRLKLVPASVQTYSKTLGFQGAPDSSVNGTLKIGSRVQGSGDVFACWDDRVIIVYEVIVEKVEEKKPAVCDLLTITTIDSRRVRINVNSTLNDATLTAVRLSLDGKTVDVAANQLPYEYTFANDGTYDVTASLLTTLNGQTQQPITSANCAKKVTINTKVTSYKCENVVVTKTTGTRTVKVTVNTSVSGGAAIKSYEVNFGDGTTKTFTTNQEITHTYAKDGNYTVKAKVTYTVDGKDVTKEEKCEGTVSYTTVTPPTTITKTGAGHMVALFVATVVAGYVFASRRYARQ